MNPETPTPPKPDLSRPAPQEFLDLAKKPNLGPEKTKTLTDLLQHSIWLGLMASGGSRKDPIPMFTFPQPPGFTPEDSHKIFASWGVIPESAIGKPEEIEKHFGNFINDLAKNNRAAVVENVDEALPHVFEAAKTGPLAIVSKDHKQTVAMWPIGDGIVFMLKTTGDPQKDQFPFYIAAKPELLGLPPIEKLTKADAQPNEAAPTAERSGFIKLLRKIFNLRLLLERIRIFIEHHNPFRKKQEEVAEQNQPASASAPVRQTSADIHPPTTANDAAFIARQKGESPNGSHMESTETTNPHQPAPANVDSLSTTQSQMPPSPSQPDTNGNHNVPPEPAITSPQKTSQMEELSEEKLPAQAQTAPEETRAQQQAPRREYNRSAGNRHQSGEAHPTNSSPRRTDDRRPPRSNGSRTNFNRASSSPAPTQETRLEPV